MKIGVVGAGYVGLVTGACLAEKGNTVVFIDIDEKRVNEIKKAKPAIHEPGLNQLLTSNRVSASDDFKKLSGCEVIFITVPTPSKVNGAVDLQYAESCAKSIAKVLDSYSIVVIKSTVPPGTTERIGELIEKVSGKKVNKDFGLCMNPEFLRQGSAINDFKNPDRIVIGSTEKRVSDKMKKLYKAFDVPIIHVDIRTAEFIKYVSNAFLATKISFANEIANICEHTGADVVDVMKAVALDNRISPNFFGAGIGFGGSCFPKDMKALVSYAMAHGHNPHILESVMRINESQPRRMLDLLEMEMDVKGKNIAVLGLSFKPNTDDIRGAPSIHIIGELLKKGANITVYDPRAMDNIKELFGRAIDYANTAKTAIKGKDAALFCTEWEEFKGMQSKDFKTMKQPVVVDGRRIFDPQDIKGIRFKAIGYGRNIKRE